MKVVFDIGHPGHVHYFRNLYRILKEHQHDILVFSRDKEVTHDLLRYYQIPYINRGKGKKGFIGKLFYLFYASLLIFYKGLRFKPDVLLSFASPYASLASLLLRSKNIILDDTEVGRFERYIYQPLADVILTPASFKEYLGKSHVRFNGFMELAYLLPTYYTPDSSIFKELGLEKNESYIIIRFVSWEASHDKGQKGLTLEQKHEIVEFCKGFGKVFISSEQKLPDNLVQYKLTISPDKLHDALAYAKLYIGEGATTASEACILGVPAVYINTISAGTIEEEEDYGLVYGFRGVTGVKEKIKEILEIKKSSEYKILASRLINGRIDLTAFLLWLVENTPQSIQTAKENPNIQEEFKYQIES